MDRFKDLSLQELLFPHPYLHSSMDRFKVFKEKNKKIKRKSIYIPVWIDLKIKKQGGEHSINHIYIPVWIDLKNNDVVMFITPFQFTFQYG